MSVVLSTSLATLSDEMMTGHISSAYASAQLRLMAQIALLLEQEVNAFRILEQHRKMSSSLEEEAMQKLHELARMPEPPFKVIRAGADIVPMHPKTGDQS